MFVLSRVAIRTSRRGLHDAVIVSAVRSPQGSFLGSLSTVKGTELASITIKGALSKANVPADHVNEVLLGNVLQAGQGQAPTTQASIGAGIPVTVPCTTINKVCASGMKAVIFGAQSILLGDVEVVVAGGYESMSQVPYYMDGRSRGGLRLGDGKIVDGIIKDGLWDVYNNFHMGNCAEHCVKTYSFTREQQDAYAIASYEKAAKATKAGYFAGEIIPIPVTIKGKTVTVTEDEEYTKIDFAKIPTLKPAFDKEGSVTAANSSTLNDGASAIVITSSEYAKRNSIKPLARIVSYADAATKPIDFTIAPSLVVPIVLKKAGLKVEDIDLWEINEAFSVVALANIQLLGLDADKVNVNGGGVSLGHPIGSSGSRIVASLVHELHRTGKRYGCAAICNGGGGASAIIVERLSE